MKWIPVKNRYIPKRKYLLILDDEENVNLEDTRDVTLGEGDKKETVRFYDYWIWPGGGARIKFYCFVPDIPDPWKWNSDL